MNLKKTIAISTGLLLAGIAAPQTHAVSVLPSSPGHPFQHIATHINDDGYVAGYIQDGHYVFIYRPTDQTIHVTSEVWPSTPSDLNSNGTLLFMRGVYTEASYTWSIGQAPFRIPNFGSNRIAGRTINNSGVVAAGLTTSQWAFGGGVDFGLITDAITWSAASGHALLPRATNGQSVPLHIASNGVVRGLRFGNSFSWTPGSSVLALFGAPNVGANEVFDMNGSGVGVGGNSGRAIRFAPGDSSLTYLTQSGVQSFAKAISEDGTAVGWFNNSGAKPCYWLPGSTTPIQLPLPLTATQGSAEGLNSRGEIVGSATINNVNVSVLWTPIPVSQTFTFSTKDGDGSANRGNVPYQILDVNGVSVASGTTNGSGQATATLLLGSYTLVASAHSVFFTNSPLANTGAITVSASGVTGDRNLEIGTLEAYFTMGGRIYRGAGTMTIGGVSMALNRSRAGNWLTDGGNAKSFTATVTINGQTRAIPGTLIVGRDHTTLSFDWNNGS